MYVMGLGAIALTFSVCYIAYMRYKYESMGYYTAIDEEGKEVYKVKKSKWDWWGYNTYDFSREIIYIARLRESKNYKFYSI